VRLLLDTHVMLWWALGDQRLTTRGQSLIADDRNDCFVSIASVWEVAIKTSARRGGLPTGITASTYAALIDEAGFELLDVRRSHAIELESIPPIHGDPFDRLMIAKAVQERMTLLTHDRIVGSYGKPVMLV
jgi:PIN domain nuclease of toxin-antitoxin system